MLSRFPFRATAVAAAAVMPLPLVASLTAVSLSVGLLASPVSAADDLPTQVKAQTKLVTDATTKLETLATASTAAKDPARLDEIAKISVKKDLSDFTKAVDIVAANLDSDVTSRRLADLLAARQDLAAKMDALKALQNDPHYLLDVPKTVRDEADAALTKAKDTLATAPYAERFGDKDGSALVALVSLHQALLTASSDAAVFGDFATDPLPSETVERLKAGFPKLKALLSAANDREEKGKDLKKRGAESVRLLPRKDGRTIADDLSDRIAAVVKRRKEIPGKVPDWLKAVADSTDQRSVEILKDSNDIRRRKTASSAIGFVARQKAQGDADNVTAVLAAWEGVKPLLTAIDADAADAAAKKVKTLEGSRDDLNENLTILGGLLATTAEDTITQEVRLSFFPDVTRLLRILNPNTRLIDPRSGKDAVDSGQLRKDLRAKETDLLEKRGQLADVKTRIQRIDSLIAAAEAAARRNNDLFQQTSGTLQGFTDNKGQLEALLAGTTDPAQLQKIQSQIGTLQKKIDAQTTIVAAAQKDKEQADATKATLLDEQNGLPAKRAAAEAEQTTAENGLNALRGQIGSLAQDESDAFAAERDNAPYLAAEPFAGDPDPVRRLYLYGDPTGRTIYLRGARDDVRAARDIIAEFDRPAPQTRLTFYTMQLNGDDDALNPNKINGEADGKDGDKGVRSKSAFTIVDENLDAVSAGTKTVIDALRKAVEEEINARVKVSGSSVGAGAQGRTPNAKRLDFYAKQVQTALGYWANIKDAEKVTRYTLPDPIRMTTLGEIIIVLSLGDRSARHQAGANFENNIRPLLTAATGAGGQTQPTTNQLSGTKKLIDDLLSAVVVTMQSYLSRAPQRGNSPPAAPTPGQATPKASDRFPSLYRIFGLDLARPAATNTSPVGAPKTGQTPPTPPALTSTQQLVLNAVKKQLQGSPIDPSAAEPIIQEIIRKTGMPATPTAVGIDSAATALTPQVRARLAADLYDAIRVQDSPEEMTPAQKEILGALLARARTEVAGTIYNLVRQIDDLPEEIRYSSSMARRLRDEYLPLVGWIVWDSEGNKEIEDGIDKWRTYGLNALGANELPTDPAGLARIDRQVFEIARVQYVANPLSQATGRIEAADLMVRDIMDDFDLDLKRGIRLPALLAIRQQLGQLKGVSFGGIEETSFLATNRRIARVDPVGSGSLTVDEQANFAESAQNLANLATKVAAQEKAQNAVLGTASVAGLTSLAGANPALTAGLGLTEMLSSLLGPAAHDPQTVAAETYSITSGNLYKVTPIFGPSGQAMRFNFDFVGTTRVREPSGSINPALPRIERHTINTEVAISSLELRPISQFDSNYQIGMPTQKTGGLPFLNQVPGLRDLPIVGYFSIRQGKPSLRQRSIIAAQSLIYPTIADVAGLVLDAASLPVTVSPEIPGSSREASEKHRIRDIEISQTAIQLGDTIGITVRLQRPVTQETTLRLSLADTKTKRYQVLAPDTRVLRRGQDEATFAVMILNAVEKDDSVSTVEWDAATRREKRARLLQLQKKDRKTMPNDEQKEMLDLRRTFAALEYVPTVTATISLSETSGLEESRTFALGRRTPELMITREQIKVSTTIMSASQELKPDKPVTPGAPLLISANGEEFPAVWIAIDQVRSSRTDGLGQDDETTRWRRTYQPRIDSTDLAMLDLSGAQIDGNNGAFYLRLTPRQRSNAELNKTQVAYLVVRSALNEVRVPLFYRITGTATDKPKTETPKPTETPATDATP